MKVIIIRDASKTEMTSIGSVGLGPDTMLGAVPDTRKKKRMKKQVLPRFEAESKWSR